MSHKSLSLPLSLCTLKQSKAPPVSTPPERGSTGVGECLDLLLLLDRFLFHQGIILGLGCMFDACLILGVPILLDKILFLGTRILTTSTSSVVSLYLGVQWNHPTLNTVSMYFTRMNFSWDLSKKNNSQVGQPCCDHGSGGMCDHFSLPGTIEQRTSRGP